MSTPRIGAAYIRVSTDDQLEFSPDSQLAKIREYAAAHNIVLPEEFIFSDEGISGRSTDKREGFQQMIGMAKEKPRPFEVILLWKFSRFARSREDSILYKSMLRRDLGIEVISITEPVGDDKMAVLIEAMIEAMDEYYSINLAEEVRRGMTQRVKSGKHITYAPFGYRVQDGNLVPDEDKAGIALKIFADFASGKGMRTIAAELNALGIKTKFGNPVENRGIKYILRNPVYIGKLRFTPTGKVRRNYSDPNTLVVDGSHEPLVTRQLYDEVQQKLDHLEAITPHRAHPQGKMHTLKGIVRCSNCGATMYLNVTQKTPKGGPSLQCHNYTRGKCAVSHAIQYHTLLNAVLEQLRHDILQSGVAALQQSGQAAAPAQTDAIEAVKKQIAREQRKLPRIREAYEAGIDTLDEYRQRRTQLEQGIAQLEQQLEKLHEQAAPVRRTPTELRDFQMSRLAIILSDENSEQDKNTALLEIVEKIVFYRQENRFDIIYRA